MNAAENISYCTKEDLESILSKYIGVFLTKQDILCEKIEALACDQQKLQNSVNKLSDALSLRIDSTDIRLEDVVKRTNIIEGSIQNLQMEAADHLQSALSHENIIREIEDRNRRASNVIMFDIPEAFDQDLQQVGAIIEPLGISATPVSLTRIGETGRCYKARQGEAVGVEHHPRPLIVTFNSRSAALQVLKNRHRLVVGDRPIQVKSDQTIMQREQLVAARRNLEDRRMRGEMEWTIKFQHGVPKVVKIDGFAG